MEITRIRLDSQGILTQNKKGELQRIGLDKNQLKNAFIAPKKFIESNYYNNKNFSDFFDKNKKLLTKIDLFNEDLGFLSHPIRTYYGIEPRCNLACKFCGPRDFHEGYTKETEEKEDFFLKEFAKAGNLQVQFTGGEIFLRSNKVVDLVKKASNYSMAVILSTNGVWPKVKNKEKLIKKLSKFKNIIQVKISIEGTKKFHEFIRGKNTYDETIDTLALFSKYKLNPRISTTIFKSSANKNNLLHLVKLSKKYSAGLQVTPLRTAGLAKNLINQVPTKKQLIEYTKYATKLRKKHKINLSFNFDIYDPIKNIPKYDLNSPFSCGAPLMGLHVTHTGETYTCGFAQEIPEFMAGKINKENSYLNIWQNSPIIKQFKKTKKSNECQKCEDYGKGCWGGCWVMGWVVSGKINGMDPYCPKHGLTKKIIDSFKKKKNLISPCKRQFVGE